MNTSCSSMAGLIDKLKQFVFFKITTIYLRYLMGFAFVFASIVKIRGERFTQISPSEPVGYFFEAMYRSGFYWNFLGISQFTAGAILMSQRFSTIGAAIFFPIILNVFVITTSVNFGTGTPAITGLMLLGTVYLLLWDYKKYAILLKPDHKIHLDLAQQPEDKFMTDPLWTITGLIFLGVTVLAQTLMSIFGRLSMPLMALTLFTVGIIALVAGLLREKKRKSHNLGSGLY